MSPAYAQDTKICVDPTIIIDVTKTVGTTFTINVNVTDVTTGIGGFDLMLKFDTTILNATAISGEFFGPESSSSAGASYVINKTRNNVLGYAMYFVAMGTGSSYQPNGRSESGVLGTIEFIVENVGVTPLDLWYTVLGDADGNSIIHGAFDGYFSNTGYANPVADFTFDPPSPILGETISFNAAYDPVTGSGSYDIDGYIVSWEWDFGDGATDFGETVQHNYTEVRALGAGKYGTTVTLTITDNSSLTNTATKDVILSGHNIAVINVQPNQTYVMQNRAVSISVTVKNKGSYTERLNVTACYNGTPVAPLTTIFVAATKSRDISFIWSTSGVANGPYIISANATHYPESPSDIEYIVKDNTFNDSTVTVVSTPVHDIAVTKVTPSPSLVFVGDNVNIDVTIANQGFLPETFNASAYYDTNFIETKTVTMPALTSQTLAFAWDTVSVPWGVYSISVNVSAVLDEVDTANNNLTDGLVGVALHNINISSLSAPTSVVVGTEIEIEVVLKNDGRKNATFTASFYYDDVWIANRTVEGLAPSAATSRTVLWDTGSVATGSHTIKVKVPQLEGELVATDNERTQEVSLVPRVHNIAVTSVTANPTTVVRGKTVDISMSIQNLGNVGETANASVSYDTTVIEIETGITLTMGESRILNFTWDTPAGIPLTTHTIKAEAQILEDADTTDNTKTTQVTIAIHDITVVSITTSKTEVAIGESVIVTVVVKNQGNFTESFSVTANYGDNLIGIPVNVNNLAKEQPQTVTFTWNTAGVSPGTYKIKARANPVPDEEDTTNNFREDDTVTVKQRSTVLISATPNPTTVGAEVTVTGSIDPTHAGVTVTVWYRKAGASAWNNLTATQTNINGQYSCTWTPAAGTYEVKASWEGDEDTESGESTMFNLTVNEAPGGTPLHIIVAAGVLIIIAVGVVAYYLIRKKP